VLDEVSGVAKYFLSTDDGARQFQDARKLFECAIARRAAQQADAEQIKTLREALESNLSSSKPDDLARTDMEFHYAIAMISGNRIVTSICDAPDLSNQRTTTLQVARAAEQAKAQHQEISARLSALTRMRPRRPWEIISMQWLKLTGRLDPIRRPPSNGTLT
jgi:DNA-binding FadR family transcriptional regulator